MVTSLGAPGAHGAPETSIPARRGSSALSPRATNSSKTTGTLVLLGPDTPPALSSSIHPQQRRPGLKRIALLTGSRGTGRRPRTGLPEPAGKHRGVAPGQAPHAGAAPQAARPLRAGPAVPLLAGLSRCGTAEMPEGRSPATGRPLRAASGRGPAAVRAAGRRLSPGPGRRRRSPPRLQPALGHSRRSAPRGPAPAGRPREAAPGPRGHRTGGPVPRLPRARRSRGQLAAGGLALLGAADLPAPARPCRGSAPRPAQAGRHRPPRSARPRSTKSRAQPGPARPPYRRCGGGGRRGPRREPWKEAGTGDGRGWRAGGAGAFAVPGSWGRRGGAGAARGGGARGLAAARPKRSRGSRDPSDPGARHRPPRRRTPRPLLPARGVEGAAPPDPRRPRCGPGLGAGPAASGGSAAGAAPSACGLPAPAAALGPFCIRRAARIPVSRPQCPHEDETTLLPRGLHMRYRL